MQSSRREFLALAALWGEAVSAAQTHAHAQNAATQGAAYKHSFFSPVEITTLRSLARILIPATPRSRGAATVAVDEYIDFVLARAAQPLQMRWHAGLTFFTNIDEAKREAMLQQLAANEWSPESDEDQFFILLKAAVVDAFYTSEEGITKELGYQGLSFKREFEGCTHEVHRAPEGHQPLLRRRQ